ncbi:MAG TPA: flagellin [Sphingomicrobium sp.]|jgi:flagellar hook-associated protein 3 FlgL|nr:flagellin [Sphingomicrobium sp.]
MINATGNRMTLEIARQSRLAKAVQEIQISISTGKRIQRPSDDPAASVRIASIRRAQADSAVWKRNVDLGASLAAQANDVLKTLNDRLARAQELTVEGATGSLPQSARDTIADELRGIADEVASLQLTQSSLGQPLFSSGQAREMRFSDGIVFAPVPSQSDVFQSGGQSLSQQLQTMAAAVQSGDRIQLDSALTTADALIEHGTDVASTIGNAAARLDRLTDSQASRAIDLTAERSGLEDTDLTTAIATLNAQQLTLDAAQAAFARINRRSLFDLLA